MLLLSPTNNPKNENICTYVIAETLTLGLCGWNSFLPCRSMRDSDTDADAKDYSYSRSELVKLIWIRT